MKKIVMSVACVFSLSLISAEQSLLLSSSQRYEMAEYNQLAISAQPVAVSSSSFLEYGNQHNYKGNQRALPDLFQSVLDRNITLCKSLLNLHLQLNDFSVFTQLYTVSGHKAPFLHFFARVISNREYAIGADSDSTYNSLSNFMAYVFDRVSFDYSIRDSNNKSVLHVLAKLLTLQHCYVNNVEDIFNLILEKIPSNKKQEILNLQDNDGNTVLHVLVNSVIENNKHRAPRRTVVLNRFKKLVQEGASCHIKNKNGRTPAGLITASYSSVNEAEKLAVFRNVTLSFILYPLAQLCGMHTLLSHSDATLLHCMLQVASAPHSI